MNRKIFILRHGETQFNLEQRLQGHCNSDLTQKGKAQAQRIGACLKKYLNGRAYSLYSSPLGRAMQTARIVCEEIGCNRSQIIKEARLKEFSLGLWEQKAITSLINVYPKLLDNRDWYLKAPRAESYDSVRARLISWLSELPESEEIIAVSHGLTGIVLRGILLCLSYQEVWKQDLPQDAFFVIENGFMKRVDCFINAF